MVRRAPLQPSPKLLALQKDFQQIASMAGFLNSSMDLPQLRLFFTLYGRLMVADEAEGHAKLPALQAWTDRLCQRLREDSSSAIMPPQVTLSPPMPLPSGLGYSLVSTVTFTTKVTDNSYLRVRTAVLAAYQAAVALRDPLRSQAALEGAPGVPADPGTGGVAGEAPDGGATGAEPGEGEIPASEASEGDPDDGSGAPEAAAGEGPVTPGEGPGA